MVLAGAPASAAPSTLSGRPAATCIRVGRKTGTSVKRCGKARRSTQSRATLFAPAPDCSTSSGINCASLPLELLTVNTCTDDVVEILGTFHITVQVTVSGDVTTTKAYQNYQNASGFAVNMPTRKYSASFTDHQYSREDATPMTADVSVDDNYELVSNDSSPNMIVRFHSTIHFSNGIPIVNIDSVDAKCAGEGGSFPAPTP
jgi:hypothetical protein